LHFYETFLAEYDPKLREVRGVYYTPEPVVQFIVRAVDDVLKDHFGLKDGLADTSKVKIKVDSDRVKRGKRQKDEISVHKVQLLDIATGTGTFPAEIMKQIYARFKGQEGLWGSYVEKDLLPRMHGFELLVASYAMCHMKLDMVLKETGYDSSKSSKRLNVYLTNSLEEHHKDSHLPFANWLSTEANEASRIKRDMPIMIALGNPPYSGHSANKGKWIQNLLDVYKKEPGGKVRLQERMYKWLQDDYVKFIRLGEYYIEKNGEGVLAYITNHGYLDNPTFRGMRWHLMNTFDDIYILDLHGSTKKMEVAPAGKADKNVFDIQQGVSINFFVKNNSKEDGAFADVYHADLWDDKRELFDDDGNLIGGKYYWLLNNDLASTNWTKLNPKYPFLYLNHQEVTFDEEYDEYIKVTDIFPTHSVGMVTARDKLTIHFSKKEVWDTVNEFVSMEVEDAREF
ncbi:MAG: DNA methyltransferase, partial [Alphaproteobacteria bacterium]|nr:DNA methyltransferase [Alphaproteobacteria bacterium]